MVEKKKPVGKNGPPDEMETDLSFRDTLITCLDCQLAFKWTADERDFYRDKDLKHAPKRCKVWKKAKTEYI